MNSFRRPSFMSGFIGILFFLFLPLPALFAGVPAGEVFLPAVGREAGANGSQFYTTVWVTNPTTSSQTFTFYFLPQGTDNSALATSFQDTVAAGETKVYENILETKFNLSNVIGAARIVSSGNLLATERIFNQATGADLGNTQGFSAAALPRTLSIVLGQSSTVVGVDQGGSENFRYNFALVETSGQPATVLVSVLDPSGNPLGSKQYLLLPYSQIQPNIDDVVPGFSSINARLTATVTGGNGTVLLYGAQVANQSQDTTGFEMSFENLGGATGATGPAGPIGPTGATGAAGARGAIGATGAIGPIGATGPQGIQGQSGLPGSMGATGTTGTPGATGLTLNTQYVFLGGTSGSTGTLTVPGGAAHMVVEGWGGGGGGAAISYHSGIYPGGGGGAGGYGKVALTVIPGNTISYAVGAGGSAAISMYGSNGGDTSITIPSDSVTFICAGGSGGFDAASSFGAGGTGGGVSLINTRDGYIFAQQTGSAGGTTNLYYIAGAGGGLPNNYGDGGSSEIFGVSGATAGTPGALIIVFTQFIFFFL